MIWDKDLCFNQINVKVGWAKQQEYLISELKIDLRGPINAQHSDSGIRLKSNCALGKGGFWVTFKSCNMWSIWFYSN